MCEAGRRGLFRKKRNLLARSPRFFCFCFCSLDQLFVTILLQHRRLLATFNLMIWFWLNSHIRRADVRNPASSHKVVEKYCIREGKTYDVLSTRTGSGNYLYKILGKNDISEETKKSGFVFAAFWSHLLNVLTFFPLTGGCSEGLGAFWFFFK